MKFLENVLDDVAVPTEKWRQDAETRRELDPDDPVAKAFDLCADTLDGHLESVRERFETLSPEEFGSLKGVTRQTVLNWIRRGQLEAYDNARDGYRIPAGAERVRHD